MEKKDYLGYSKHKNARVSPRKASLVTDMIRGKRVEDALGCLRSVNNNASFIVEKLLNSALANAIDKNSDVKVNELFISQIHVSNGQTLKRMRPRAMGRGSLIRKRMSHIRVGLDYNYSIQEGDKVGTESQSD